MAETTVKVKLHYPAFVALRNSSAVQADLKRRADAIASQAGDGYLADVSTGKTRARASVRTDTFDAVLDESQNATLERSIGAGRS